MIDVIGVPAKGVTALAGDELEMVRSADVLISSPRLLETLKDLSPGAPTAELAEWPRPLLPNLAQFMSQFSGRSVVVLATGDPLVSGIGATLIRVLVEERVRIHPAVSSVALARARMGWDAAACSWVTLVARPVTSVTRHLTPRGRVLCLSSDETTPGALAQMLTARGLGCTRLIVLSDLGAPSESRHQTTAGEWTDADDERVSRLNIVALELPELAEVGDEGPLSGPFALLGAMPGRPDTAFHTAGQLTKRDARAAALAALRPSPGEVLWDLGAGSGSVSIEWALTHASTRAVAVESRADRVQLIEQNAADFGVKVTTRHEEIEHFLARFTNDYVASSTSNADDAIAAPGTSVQKAQPQRPDAVFIGGGATAQVIEQSYQALRAGGRLVAHAVTIESEALLIEAYRAAIARGDDADLRRISVETAEALGSYLSWKPARAIVQLSVTKAPEKENQ